MSWVKLTGYVRDGAGRHAPGEELEVSEHSARRLSEKGVAVVIPDPVPEEVSADVVPDVGVSEPVPRKPDGKGKLGGSKPRKKTKSDTAGK